MARVTKPMNYVNALLKALSTLARPPYKFTSLTLAMVNVRRLLSKAQRASVSRIGELTKPDYYSQAQHFLRWRKKCTH